MPSGLYDGCPVSVLDRNGNIIDLGWVEEEEHLQNWALNSHVWVRMMRDNALELWPVRLLLKTDA